MITVEFPAMGTRVVAIGDDPAEAEPFFAAAEAVFSRFDSSSELSALNRDPRVSIEVSPDLAACLHDARELRDRTGGLIDPAIGNAVIAWGYDRTFTEVEDRGEAGSIAAIGEWSISDNVVTRRPGTRLDLGGIAKGWTADRAVASGLAYVVSAGGDVSSRLDETAVSIEDPWGDVAATVRLGSGGLATSSSTRRRWQVGDVTAHHIIDPRRLAPATSPIFSATVMAATAVEAEAGAKAVLLHGEHGLTWAETQDWIAAALVVWHDGSVYATTGWEMAA
ncbi:MAG: FAD:protein FMN transferase [Acidimicrobiia bacterium]